MTEKQYSPVEWAVHSPLDSLRRMPYIGKTCPSYALAINCIIFIIGIFFQRDITSIKAGLMVVSKA
jgi:hypothetical protein